MYLEHFAKGIIDFQHIHAPSSNNKFLSFQIPIDPLVSAEKRDMTLNQFIVHNQTSSMNLCFILNSISFSHCRKKTNVSQTQFYASLQLDQSNT